MKIVLFRSFTAEPEVVSFSDEDRFILIMMAAGILHISCVHPDYRRMGIAGRLVSLAEEALQKEGIQKIFGLVFRE